MPLTNKGKKILSGMEKEYGSTEKGEQVFYASRNVGKISGVDSATRSLDELIAGASAVTDRVKAADADTVVKEYGHKISLVKGGAGYGFRNRNSTQWFKSESEARRVTEEFVKDLEEAMRGDGDQRATLINTALEMEARANKHRGMTGGSTSSDHGLAYKDLMAAAHFFRKAADDASWLKEAERAKLLADKTSVRAMTDEPNGGAKKTPQIVPGRNDTDLQKFEIRMYEKAEHWTFDTNIWAKDESDARAKIKKDYPPNQYSIRDLRSVRSDSDTLAYGVSGKSRVPMAVDDLMVRDRIDRLAQGVHSLLKRGESVIKADAPAKKGFVVSGRTSSGKLQFYTAAGDLSGFSSEAKIFDTIEEARGKASEMKDKHGFNFVANKP